jgi:hypothetical protein
MDDMSGFPFAQIDELDMALAVVCLPDHLLKQLY